MTNMELIHEGAAENCTKKCCSVLSENGKKIHETSDPEEIELIDCFLKATFEEPRLYWVANYPMFMFEKEKTPQLIESVNGLIEKIKAFAKNSDRDDIPRLPEMEPISINTPYKDISDLVRDIFNFFGEMTGRYLCEDEKAHG